MAWLFYSIWRGHAAIVQVFWTSWNVNHARVSQAQWRPHHWKRSRRYLDRPLWPMDRLYGRKSESLRGQM